MSVSVYDGEDMDRCGKVIRWHGKYTFIVISGIFLGRGMGGWLEVLATERRAVHLKKYPTGGCSKDRTVQDEGFLLFCKFVLEWSQSNE